MQQYLEGDVKKRHISSESVAFFIDAHLVKKWYVTLYIHCIPLIKLM